MTVSMVRDPITLSLPRNAVVIAFHTWSAIDVEGHCGGYTAYTSALLAAPMATAFAGYRPAAVKRRFTATSGHRVLRLRSSGWTRLHWQLQRVHQ